MKTEAPPGRKVVNGELMQEPANLVSEPLLRDQGIIDRETNADNLASTPTLTTASTIRNVKLVIGLDFGTTYTGVSFIMSGYTDSGDVQVISDWGGGMRPNEQLEKVPSIIAYAAENDDLVEDCFGYHVQPHHKRYSWTKLLLDETVDATEFDNPNLETHKHRCKLPAGKSATEVITDFLYLVHKHTMARLCIEYGDEMVKVRKKECWVTHPATWSEFAKNATRTAASKAGFGFGNNDQLKMITEPEAAAVAILSRNVDKNPGFHKKGDSVLICDMGGGTVDLQCLAITKLEPLRMDELCEGEGRKIGSTYIDDNLLKWMEDTFEEAFGSVPPNKLAANSRFMESWEVAKKTLDANNGAKEFRLSLPGMRKYFEQKRVYPASYDLEEHEVIITGFEIMKLFDPIISETLKLVKSQVARLKSNKQRPLKAIILCGGLGTSGYVWTKLREYCASTFGHAIDVVTDDRAWSSVARGAAIRGLDGSFVVSRRSKRHYGVGVHQEFRPRFDDEADAFQCPFQGKRAGGYISWCVKKGKRLTPNMRLPLETYVAVQAGDEEKPYIWELYSCGLDTAPNRVEGDGIRLEAVISLELNRAHGSSGSDSAASMDAVPTCIFINVVFKMGSDKGVIIVEALHERRVIGTAVLDYTVGQAVRPAQSAGPS